MADHKLSEIIRLKEILDENYRGLLKELEGSSIPKEQRIDPCLNYEDIRYLDRLSLRLAASNFINVLSEIKKLK